MNNALMNAILSMDAYNRGYGASIRFGNNPGDNNYSLDTNGIQIGTATIIRNKGDASAENISFYALAYDYNGETIIAYRGTDSLFGDVGHFFLNGDVRNGFDIGAGDATNSPQGNMAIQFYNTIIDEVYGISADPHSSALNVSLTGHSLGGGLAGYVADLYVQSGTVFDNMAFEHAASLEYTKASLGILSSEAIGMIYGSEIPWENSFSGLHAYYVDGEFLGINRVFQDTPTSPLDIGSGVNLGSGYDGLDAHSMSTLAILLYADVTAGGVTDWKNAAKYFWPVMYDKDFAGSIEFNNSTTLAGRDHDSGDYASIMRQALAYSIIDEGTKVFGDTGIRAFYDDANDFGKILTTNLPDTVPSMIVGAFGKEISEVFIQYAAQLALNRVELANVTNTVLKGVLSSENFGILTLDLSDTTWSVAGGGTPPPIVGKEKIITKIMNGIEELHTLDGDAGGLVGVNDNDSGFLLKAA